MAGLITKIDVGRRRVPTYVAVVHVILVANEIEYVASLASGDGGLYAYVKSVRTVIIGFSFSCRLPSMPHVNIYSFSHPCVRPSVCLSFSLSLSITLCVCALYG